MHAAIGLPIGPVYIISIYIECYMHTHTCSAYSLYTTSYRSVYTTLSDVKIIKLTYHANVCGGPYIKQDRKELN
jgi:hypothetical protein